MIAPISPEKAVTVPSYGPRMLELGSAEEPFDLKALEASGGFAWWYLDLVDSSGNGLVLIWFFGLPFLPADGRTGVQGPARQRPGINVAVYRDGKQAFYLLQEYAEDAIEHSADMSRICIGKSVFCLTVENGDVSFTANIETEVPGSGLPLTGLITARGPLRRGREAGPATGEHRWCPISAPASGSARLGIGEQPVADLQGRAYLDRNSSRLPLTGLGIEQWRWGRLALPDREVIFYELRPQQRDRGVQALVLSVSADGEAQQLQPARLVWSDPARDVYALRYHRALRIAEPDGSELLVRLAPPVDNGPFYLRFLLEAHDARTGQTGSGVGELVQPGRIDIPRMRPFVQMRVHQVGGWNSPWLPLFSGPRGGRLGRLMNHLGARNRGKSADAGGRP